MSDADTGHIDRRPTMYGYAGRVLRVDLSAGEAWAEPLEPAALRLTIGGIGLGTYLLLKYCPPGVDPLAPEAPLLFVTSPLVGTAVTTTAKYAVLAKSPLTGLIGESLSSSHLALELKRTGYDALVVTGACRAWSYLVVTDDPVWPAGSREGRNGQDPPTGSPADQDGLGAGAAGGGAGPGAPAGPAGSVGAGARRAPAALRDARHLLGLGTWQTERAVRAALAAEGLPAARTAVIGPAGEHLVRYATISNDGRHAGRGGLGAVMGSKRLKAVAVRGRRPVAVADPARLRAANARLIERSAGPATAKYRRLGTPANVLVFDRLGILPTRNFQAATFESAEAVSGEELLRVHHAQTVGCASCTVGCEHLYKTFDTGPEVQTRLEYESLFALGPLLGVGDPNVVIRLARQCDELGLDTISAGGTLAWAMECVQRGLLPATVPGPDVSREESPVFTTEAQRHGEVEGSVSLCFRGTDVVRHQSGERAEQDRLGFGAAAALPAALDAIAHRRGALGSLLAEGSRRAAARLGGGTDAWAMHVKGLELPGYEPRGLKTLALGFAVTPRGACHNRSAAYEYDFSGRVDRFAAEAGRGELAAAAEDQEAVLDSLIVCKFIRKCFDDLYAECAELYRYVTGWPCDGAALRRAGERITTLKKLFNVREGWTRADDTLPPRILQEALADGPGAGEGLTRAALDLMIAGYYAARGWTADGQVPQARLREPGLDALLALTPGPSPGSPSNAPAVMR